MKPDKDMQIMQFHWNRLSYLEKKYLRIRVSFFSWEDKFFRMLIVGVAFVFSIVTPVPRRRNTAHWL